MAADSSPRRTRATIDKAAGVPRRPAAVPQDIADMSGARVSARLTTSREHECDERPSLLLLLLLLPRTHRRTRAAADAMHNPARANRRRREGGPDARV